MYNHEFKVTRCLSVSVAIDVANCRTDSSFLGPGRFNSILSDGTATLVGAIGILKKY